MRLVDPDRPGRRIDVEERRTESFDGTAIAYHVAGSGLPVLLATGLGGTFPVWRHLYRYLGDRYRFHAWDFRGLYRSGRPSRPDALRVADHARDAVALLDAESAERFAIVGWSSGTQVALEVCRAAPDRVAALVLVGGTAGRPWEAIRAAALVAPVLRGALGVASRFPRAARLAAGRVGRWPETLPWLKRAGLLAATLDEEVFADIAEDLATVDVGTFLTVLREFAEHDAHDLLPALTMPVLVVAGDRDPLVSRRSTEELARAIPGAEVLLLPGGTHYAAVEFPEPFNLRIEKFFVEHGWS